MQALYLKYRPRAFDEIEGQEHITRTLKNAIEQERVAHAYLLVGPRGTGKTTTARILAKAVNCLADENSRPDNTCSSCRAFNEDRILDLIEIDGASNTSVDDVRDLREKVDFRPGEAKFKVYIIDEVHMLSNAAFNALLKTLEEPPPHVIFVLATTDPQKIPATVISRVQRFDFRRLTVSEIVTRVGEIAKKENLQVEASAVELIARQATGSMRDAISLLDQLTAFGGDEITVEHVQRLLGAAPHETLQELVGTIQSRDVAGALETMIRAIDVGAEPRQFTHEIVEYFRGLLLLRSNSGESLALGEETRREMNEQARRFSPAELVRAIRLFSQAAVELRAASSPTLPLEIALIELLLDEVSDDVGETPRSTVSPSTKRGVAVADVKMSTPPRRSVPQRESVPGDKIGKLNEDSLREHWSNVLGIVRTRNKVAEALLRDAEPVKVEGNQILLGFRFEGHAERFEKQANGKALIEKAIEEIFGEPYRIKCILSPQVARRKAVESDPLIRTAIRQMGAEITDIHDQ